MRTSKTALAAAALYALPREPLAALRWLRAYEAAALPVEGPGGPPEAWRPPNARPDPEGPAGGAARS